MDTNVKTILIVMPVYNGQKTISMAIESILEQSYRNIRLVIIDDCSSDNTLAIASLYLKDPRVSLFRNKQNMGAYYSRNVGLYLFKDKVWGYFTTHDADDVSFKHRYVKLVRMLRQPRVIAVQDSFKRIELSSGKTLSEGLTMAHAIFSRKAFNVLGYFDNVRFGADWEYWYRTTIWNKINKYRTTSTREVLGESFVHETNLTVQIPLGSRQRKNYMKDVQQKVKELSANENYYYDFDENLFCTERVK